jgi:uncharacterized FAD-dependent dehydrogenase
MSRLIQDLKVSLDETIEEKLQILAPGYGSYRILRESVDARRRGAIHQVFTVEVFDSGESAKQEDFTLEKVKWAGKPPIIIGSGPAGLFAAIRFVERGIPCILFERGSEAEKRVLGINQYWRYGKLDPHNNVCFGEGGAGLYSDGKLITRIKSEHIPYVLNRLVHFGAPEEIQYLANPHVGSDRIRRIIPKIRHYLKENGCTIHFNTPVKALVQSGQAIVGIETEGGETYHSDHVILATGHSAEDMLLHLADLGVHLEGKSFALGFRIEHPQPLINRIQFRQWSEHPKLGSANYKLTHHDAHSQVGVYSFCMCPGGYVLSSGTDPDGVVSNGMSNYKRNSPFANAAIVITVDHEKMFKSTFGGLEFRRDLEHEAKRRVGRAGGTKEIPVQKAQDFMLGRLGETLPSSTPSGVKAVRLDDLLPNHMTKKIREALENFESKMPGFLGPQAQLHGVESRTSCPIRVTRNDETLESVSHAGLYPCGEGAGYAGGITSAAVDGIKIAEAIVNSVSSKARTL